MRMGLAIDGLVGATGPQRILVELQAFAPGAPEDHCPEPAVAGGQSFRPGFGGCLIPEAKIRHRRGHFAMLSGVKSRRLEPRRTMSQSSVMVCGACVWPRSENR